MKIVERILWSFTIVCILFLVTLGGAYLAGYINGKLNCPPPKMEQTTSLHSSHHEAITKLTAFNNDNFA